MAKMDGGTVDAEKLKRLVGLAGMVCAWQPDYYSIPMFVADVDELRDALKDFQWSMFSGKMEKAGR